MISVFWLTLIVILILLIPTAYAGLIGAPYAPTSRKVVREAFEQLEIGEGDVLVDLGSGDGSILIDANARGAKAIGYELSPIMWFISYLRIKLATSQSRTLSPLRNPSVSPVSETPPLVRGGSSVTSPSLTREGVRGWVCYGNFYKKKLPEETTVVFSFLMPKIMPNIVKYLAKQDLPKAKYFLAYMFPLPKEYQPLQVIKKENTGPIYVYRLPELTA